ncbi:hypothetical protein [Streptomyces sp. NPDC054797]
MLQYTATQGLVLFAGTRALGIRLHPAALAAALAVSGATHFAADRRVPQSLLQRLAEATGKKNFFNLSDFGMNGSYCLDLLCTKSRGIGDSPGGGPGPSALREPGDGRHRQGQGDPDRRPGLLPADVDAHPVLRNDRGPYAVAAQLRLDGGLGNGGGRAGC